MSKPILALIPSGYKTSKVYSILPNNGDGDFDYERNGNATRVRKDGLIEELTVDDTPRLDWLNSNCPSLKLEPQSTNLVTYSEDFSDADWSKLNATVTANSTISPSGVLNADKLVDNTVNTSHRFISSGFSTTSVSYTASIFVKKDEIRYAYLRLNDSSGTYISGTFDLQDGIVTQEENGDLSIENFGNGWYRVIGTATSNANGLSYLELRTSKTPIYSNYIGNGSDGLYVWGAQAEQGTYATSYIKTEGGTSTRFIDNCHLLNQTLFTDYPFTVYAKAKVEAIDNVVFGLIDSTALDKYLVFYFANSTQLGVIRRDASNNDSDFYNFTYSVGDTIKVAVAFISDTAYKLYVNGTELADVTSGLSIPFDHNDITLGQQRIVSDRLTRNSIDDFRVFDYTLTDAELTELTT